MAKSQAEKHFTSRPIIFALTIILSILAAAATAFLLELIITACEDILPPGVYADFFGNTRSGAILRWLGDAACNVLLLAVLFASPFAFFRLLWWKIPVKCDNCGDRHTLTTYREDGGHIYTYQCNSCQAPETFRVYPTHSNIDH